MSGRLVLIEPTDDTANSSKAMRPYHGFSELEGLGRSGGMRFPKF